MTPTIRDVAREAGVSPSTVSRVLNGTAPVKEDKRRNVLLAISKLHYHPNGIARSLRRKKTNALGLVVPDITNPFFAEAAKGVEEIARMYNYIVILCNSENDPRRERTYLEVLKEKRVDGIILVTAGGRGLLAARILKEIPIVVMDRSLPRLQVDTVVTDNVAGAYEAAKHLVTMGHRRIGIIAGPYSLAPARDRLEGYRKAFLEERIAWNPALVRQSSFTIMGGYEAMKELLNIRPRPTAVLASNDMMALGALRAIQEAHLRIPEDIAIIGYDDITVASLVNPQLTTVAQPTRAMGQMSVKMLLKRVHGDSSPARVVTLKPTLIVRESCGYREGSP